MPLNEIERHVGNPREWQPDRPTHNWFEDKPTVVWEDEYQTAHANVVVVNGIRYRDSLPSNVHLRFWYQYHGVVTIAAQYAATAESQTPQHDPAELKSEFQTLAQLWRKETRAVSVLRRKILHPAYQRIIGMGAPAVPLILKELSERPDDWMWALKSITGEDPAPENATFDEAVSAWISWGKAKHLVP
jgi:hypothetical protein